ncbi:MAG: phosphopantothenoylcysteine decarboxylase [Actinomycetales bacterium mxb001]|nr:MAG: phosphopantothenoylcysteine decarboxylase [Actinomycetales bacterium mxb001]
MTSRVLLGVSGGIAAYKACTLLRMLREEGHDVRVVPTDSALRFVGAPTWEALSGHPVSTQVWDDVPYVQHVQLGRWADIVIVAPATANTLARAASGIADDLLTTSLLTATCPVVMAPAMHTEMWLHPATQANVATLRSRGVTVLDPAVGRLTGADSGPGRLPEPADLARVVDEILAGGATQDLAGRRVVVSAGGTREPLDPVRFLGNRSSGRQGWALARRARARGADVVLVAAHVDLPELPGVRTVHVGTAAQLHEAMLHEAPAAEAVVMAAAVADFRPASYSDDKIKKADDGSEPPAVALVRNVDVLADLVSRRRPGQVVVGFAAETSSSADELLALGRAKLARKGCDLLVVNDVSEGRVFGATTNDAVILGADGTIVADAHGSKESLADAIWDAVAKRLP